MIVIALTGWGQDSDRRQSQDAGCDAHVVKPVDPARLSELIAELCSRAVEPAASALVERPLGASASS